MELLLDESHWFDRQNAAFWRGSQILSGTIDPEGYAPSEITVHLRLTGPDGRPSRELKVRGPRTDPASLADKIVGELVSAFSGASSAVPNDSRLEAERYFAEARWAFGWGLMKDAQSAADAAWALGLQTPELMQLRIRGWRETGSDPASPSVDYSYSTVSYGWPDLNRFADGRRAAELYEQGWATFVSAKGHLTQEWLLLGDTILQDLTKWLAHYYFASEARFGQEENLRLAGQQATRICEAILNHPDYRVTDTNNLVLSKCRSMLL
jgi:hypothetical protein